MVLRIPQQWIEVNPYPNFTTNRHAQPIISNSTTIVKIDALPQTGGAS